MTESALTEQPLLESEAQSSTLSDLVSTNGSNSDIEHPDDSNPPQGVLEDSEIDTMLYPYPDTIFWWHGRPTTYHKA